MVDDFFEILSPKYHKIVIFRIVYYNFVFFSAEVVPPLPEPEHLKKNLIIVYLIVSPVP